MNMNPLPATVRPWMPFSFTLLLLFVTFLPLFGWLAARFLEPDSSYSHGFLVPLVSALMLWRRRSEIAALPARPSRLGPWLLAAALAAYLVFGVVFNIGFAGGLSFIAALCGIVLTLRGSATLKAVLFPLLFLLFMIPVPKVALLAVTFKMKLLAAFAAAKLLALVPVPVQLSGTMLHLPNGTLIVDGECSGINSLVSLVTLGAAAAFFSEGSFGARACLVAGAVPVAILANVARITFLALAAYVYGVEAAMGDVFHYGAGFVLWAVSLGFYALLWGRLGGRKGA